MVAPSSIQLPPDLQSDVDAAAWASAKHWHNVACERSLQTKQAYLELGRVLLPIHDRCIKEKSGVWMAKIELAGLHYKRVQRAIAMARRELAGQDPGSPFGQRRVDARVHKYSGSVQDLARDDRVPSPAGGGDVFNGQAVSVVNGVRCVAVGTAWVPVDDLSTDGVEDYDFGAALHDGFDDDDNQDDESEDHEFSGFTDPTQGDDAAQLPASPPPSFNSSSFNPALAPLPIARSSSPTTRAPVGEQLTLAPLYDIAARVRSAFEDLVQRAAHAPAALRDQWIANTAAWLDQSAQFLKGSVKGGA
jgi:hypothetical protein